MDTDKKLELMKIQTELGTIRTYRKYYVLLMTGFGITTILNAKEFVLIRTDKQGFITAVNFVLTGIYGYVSYKKKFKIKELEEKEEFIKNENKTKILTKNNQS